MSRKSYYPILVLIYLLSGCSEVPQPEGPAPVSKIPDDRLAIYLIEGISDELMYNELPVDSIKKFGERILEYHEIVGYDTVYFAFTLEGTAIARLSKLNNKYLEWCLPFAVVCEGEVIFGAYLYHPLSSFFPYWYYATAIRKDKFTIYAPVWTNRPYDPDPRKDPRMLRVLIEDEKIREPEFVK